jgi:phosphopantetheinyl transferase
MKIAGITDTRVAVIRQSLVKLWLNANESRTFHSLDTSAAADWLAGRVALKQAFIDDLRDSSVVPGELTVANRPSGVPFIQERPGTFCSISHSEGWGVAGVSREPIGVDIEKIKTRCGHLIEYVSTDDELTGMIDREEPDVLVTKVWTMKEAAMKAWGTGLDVHPRFVRLTRRNLGSFTVDCVARPSLPVLNVVVRDLGDSMFAAASTEALHERPTIHWLDIPGVSTSDQAVIRR